jgi:hypothetical protein
VTATGTDGAVGTESPAARKAPVGPAAAWSSGRGSRRIAR